MPKRLRVGILGAGWAAEGHAAAFGRLADVEVAALWSRTQARAESLADKLEYPHPAVYEDWRTLISGGHCDVISIAAAPLLRSEPLLAALAQGCHVLVEKPLSVGPAEAMVMCEAADAARTVTACCFNWRYAPAVQTAWKAIRSDQIGAVRDLRTEWYLRVGSEFLARTPWALDLDLTNGSLGEGLSHDFDKARYLSGADFLSVVSTVTDVTVKQDDDFLVAGGRSMHLAELSAGILAQFCFSITAGEDRWSLSIIGDEGSLWIPDAGTTVIRQRHDEPEPDEMSIASVDQQTTSPDLLQHTWNRLIEDFVCAIRDHDQRHERRPSLPHLTDGLHSEQIISAVRRSSSERRWVAVGG